MSSGIAGTGSTRETNALQLRLAFWPSGIDRHESVKAHNIRNDWRVSLCVDDEEPPFAFVLIEGEAEISEIDPDFFYWATRIANRYMGEELAESYGGRNSVEGELLIRVRPNNVVARKNIAD